MAITRLSGTTHSRVKSETANITCHHTATKLGGVGFEPQEGHIFYRANQGIVLMCFQHPPHRYTCHLTGLRVLVFTRLWLRYDGIHGVRWEN